MIEWNEGNRATFEKVGRELGIRLAHDTHYDALNFEYSIVVGSELHRLDFQPTDRHTYQVTKMVETYPFAPRMFRFLASVVPYFPRVGRVEYSPAEELSVEAGELDGRIKGLVREAL